jgi:hypothetical protein
VFIEQQEMILNAFTTTVVEMSYQPHVCLSACSHVTIREELIKILMTFLMGDFNKIR